MFVKTRMVLELLLLMLLTTLIDGAADTTAACGEPVGLNESRLLSCTFSEELEHGISWFKSDNADPIVTCFKNRECTSSDPGKYKIPFSNDDMHSPTVQQIEVTNIDDEDFRPSYICLDAPTKPGTIPEKSTCRIVKRGAGTSTLTCGDAMVGTPDVLTCSVDHLLNGIHWFRDNEMIAECRTNHECISQKPELYEAFVDTRLKIKNVTVDDIDKRWTCLDSEVLHLPPTSSTCKLRRVYGTEITTDCNNHVQVHIGATFSITCKITGPLANGPTIFRGKMPIIWCTAALKCSSADETKYTAIPSQDKLELKVVIVDLTLEDTEEEYACLDDDTFPNYELQEKVKCKIAYQPPVIGDGSSANHVTSNYGIWFVLGLNALTQCIEIIL